MGRRNAEGATWTHRPARLARGPVQPIGGPIRAWARSHSTNSSRKPGSGAVAPIGITTRASVCGALPGVLIRASVVGSPLGGLTRD